MSAPIPADLRELYDAASTVKEAMPGLWIPHAGPRVVELIERIATLEAQVTALSKPVSDEEWEHHRCGVEVREENGDTCATYMTWRVDVDAIIAARLAATEPKL